VFVPESANAGVLFGVGACVEIVSSADLSQSEATSLSLFASHAL